LGDPDRDQGHPSVGGWSFEQRLQMDEKFTRAVERAFENGGERRQAAAATHGANASRPR